jgi:hypothetical protein
MEKIYGYILASAGSVILALCVYIWTRTIAEYDKMISSLFDKHEDHETRLSTLEGEHNVNACKSKKR